MSEGGARFLARKSLSKLTSPLFEFGHVFVYFRELDWPRPQGSLPPGFRFMLANPLDIASLTMGRSLPRSLLEARFASGERCVAAVTDQGEVVHAHWYSTIRAEIPEIGMQFLLEKGEAYLYDSYTLPEMRGKGIERAGSEFTCRMLQDRGWTRTYGYVRGDNLRRLKAVRQWDKVVGAIHYLRFRGCRPIVVFDRAKIGLSMRRVVPAESLWSGQQLPT
jgi:GNAT superfamily N-acetyltransferase